MARTIRERDRNALPHANPTRCLLPKNRCRASAHLEVNRPSQRVIGIGQKHTYIPGDATCVEFCITRAGRAKKSSWRAGAHERALWRPPIAWLFIECMPLGRDREGGSFGMDGRGARGLRSAECFPLSLSEGSERSSAAWAASKRATSSRARSFQ